MNLTLESMGPDDWQAVSTIYREGIETGQATFETAVPSWAEWDAGEISSCRLVAKMDGSIVGWTALSPVSQREVYAGIAEVTIYVAGADRGEGVGKALLQAVMFPENEASVALHIACGFRIVGMREKVARLHGVWRNTVLMERRSQIVGQDLFLPSGDK